MKRIALIALVAAAACGGDAEPPGGTLDRLFFPTGLAVVRGALLDGDPRLLVASSNADLFFDDETGGAVVALDPGQDPVRRTGGVNVPSFAGELAVADPAACGTSVDGELLVPEPLALVATRGSNTLNVLRVTPEGGLACEGRCGIPLTGSFADPFAVAVACNAPRKKARAFVGHLRAPSSQAWVTEYDLVAHRVLRSASIGAGPARAFAYDEVRDRLYVAGLATGSQTPLRWIELAGGGCTFGLPEGAGGCTVGQATLPFPDIELRSIALSAREGNPDDRRRAYLTARRYDLAAARTAGGRTIDFGGVLLVVDLVENAFGGVDVELVKPEIAELPIGLGIQDVRVLPRPAGRAGAGPEEIVALLATDDGVLWLYDDLTGETQAFGRDVVTGEPALGDSPFGLAVDPESATTARVYVGSFGDAFVTPVEVPLDASSPLDAAFIPTTANGAFRRIRGGTP